MCSKCGKVMRADHYTRHARVHGTKEGSSNGMRVETHLRKHDEEEAPKNMYSGIMSRNEREELEKKLICDKNIFEKNLAEGEIVAVTIVSGRVSEESLSKKHKFCLDLYRKHRQSVDTNAAVLKPWQKLVMTELEQPHARRVVWVIGRSGNEGKTWLQNYI